MPVTASAASCTRKGVELQVLGSGGPELQDKRASTSYLVWQDGRPRIVIDSGGGSALQFGRAGAHVSQLDAIFFTHLHVDHTADFAALIKSSYFEDRNRPLPVYGPIGNDFFPTTSEFVADLFDRRHGAYRYLADLVSGGEGGYHLVAHDVTLQEHEVRVIYRSPDTVVSATKVIHGGVPALAWRVELGGKVIVFSGDTNGDNGNLELLAKDADVFVAHNAIPEGETGAARAASHAAVRDRTDRRNRESEVAGAFPPHVAFTRARVADPGDDRGTLPGACRLRRRSRLLSLKGCSCAF